MNWYSFLFSEKKSHLLQRHMVFWLLWWMYFTISFFHYEQSGLQKAELEPWTFPFFIKSLLLLSIHIISCYYFINYLMPKYLFKGRYMGMVIHIMILSFLIVLASYSIHKTVLPFINTLFDYQPVIANQTIWWTSITSGLLSAPKVICAAAVIKLIKRWWLKQKEKERLEKEKLMTELQLLKAQMHPEFLFLSLANICSQFQKKNIQNASTLLLKLADILSYILYECDEKLVLLEKEIRVIKDYLLLEKNRLGEQLEIDVAIKGEAGKKMIAPLILFSFTENSFFHIGNKKLEANWINLEFQIVDNEITMKLIHGKAVDSADLSVSEDSIAKVIKRLDFYYPGNYELKTTIEPEMMMTYVRILLEESKEENKNNIYDPEQLMYATA